MSPRRAGAMQLPKSDGKLARAAAELQSSTHACEVRRGLQMGSTKSTKFCRFGAQFRDVDSVLHPSAHRAKRRCKLGTGRKIAGAAHCDKETVAAYNEGNLESFRPEVHLTSPSRHFFRWIAQHRWQSVEPAGGSARASLLWRFSAQRMLSQRKAKVPEQEHSVWGKERGRFQPPQQAHEVRLASSTRLGGARCASASGCLRWSAPLVPLASATRAHETAFHTQTLKQYIAS